MGGKYEIVRMPADKNKMSLLLEEYAPFLDAMYTKDDIELFGEINFLLDYWLFLWDTGTGFFLTKRNDAGELIALAMITKYRDIWHGKERLEIHRMALTADESVKNDEEIQGAVDYLISVAPLMGFEFLYYISRNNEGDEYKELMWMK